jgi:hypothetical protein
MPDSWVQQYQGFMVTGSASPAAAAGTTQLDVSGLAASGFTTLPAGITARAVIFSADGISSHARFLTSVGVVGGPDTVNTIKWTEDVNNNGTLDPGEDINGNGTLDLYPLPASFVPGGKVRIELQERRYNWLLTVRRDSQSGANVDVVVFFKRRFDINTDEYLFPLLTPFQVGFNQVVVSWPLGINPATNQEYKPFMRKGSYIFDANNAFWYRISNVSENLPANGQGSATITLDVPSNASSPAAAPGQGPYVMFPRNIVDVYPLGSK